MLMPMSVLTPPTQRAAPAARWARHNPPGPLASPAMPSRAGWQTAYAVVRQHSQQLTAGLSAEDQALQSMADTSPTKWHLAHSTWFFETLVLQAHAAGYQPLDARWGRQAAGGCRRPTKRPKTRVRRCRRCQRCPGDAQPCGDTATARKPCHIPTTTPQPPHNHTTITAAVILRSAKSPHRKPCRRSTAA